MSARMTGVVLALSAAAVALLAACSVGVGQTCGEAQCPQGLACTFPALPGDAGPAPQGICDYPLRAEGEPCLAANQCEASLTCSNHFQAGGHYGTCTARLAPGEACFVNRDCVSNRCQGGTGQALDGTCG